MSLDSPSSDAHLWIIDDDSFILSLLSQALAKLGYRHVSCCDTPHTALKFLDVRDTPPDIVFLDLQMPEMDGVEFVHRLAERRFTGSLVLISGMDERLLQSVETLAQSFDMNVLGYLQKPIPLNALSTLLENWSPAASAAPSPAFTARNYTPRRLAEAITRGEIINHYQPQVSVKTREVVGTEALAYWAHPQHGLIFPGEFIGVAESYGLIDQLTTTVLRGAFAQQRTWASQGIDLRISVNISSRSLASGGFPDALGLLAEKAGLPPCRVTLEMTESHSTHDFRASLEGLARLRLKGFRLAIDDFGTGYSSLERLRDLPFNELKLDKSFVRGAWSNEKLRSIYTASLDMAKGMGMEVVAEGVEDARDWEELQKTRCDLAQGFFISPPLPAEDLPDWLKHWNGTINNERLLRQYAATSWLGRS